LAIANVAPAKATPDSDVPVATSKIPLPNTPRWIYPLPSHPDPSDAAPAQSLPHTCRSAANRSCPEHSCSARSWARETVGDRTAYPCPVPASCPEALVPPSKRPMENETARGAVRRCQAVTRTDARRYMRPLGTGGQLLAAESRSSGTRPALWGRPGPRIGSPTNAAGQDSRPRAAKAPERGLGAGAKIGRSTRSCGGEPESMPFGSTSRSASLGLGVEGQDALEVVIDGTDGELDLDERQAETVRHRLFPRISSPPSAAFPFRRETPSATRRQRRRNNGPSQTT